MLKTLNKQLKEHLEVVTESHNHTIYRMGGKEGYYTVDVVTTGNEVVIGHFYIFYYDDEGIWDRWSEVICPTDDQLSLAEEILEYLAKEEQYK